MPNDAADPIRIALERLSALDRKRPGRRLTDIAMGSAARLLRGGASPEEFTAALLSPVLKAIPPQERARVSREFSRRAADIALLVPNPFISAQDGSVPWDSRARLALESARREMPPAAKRLYCAEHCSTVQALSAETPFSEASPEALAGEGPYGAADAYIAASAACMRGWGPGFEDAARELEGIHAAWKQTRFAASMPAARGFWELQADSSAGALLSEAGMVWKERSPGNLLFCDLRHRLSAGEFLLLIRALRSHYGPGRLRQASPPEESGGWKGWHIPKDEAPGRIRGGRLLRELRDPGSEDPVSAWEAARCAPKALRWKSSGTAAGDLFASTVARFGPDAALFALFAPSGAKADSVGWNRGEALPIEILRDGKSLRAGFSADGDGPARILVSEAGGPPRALLPELFIHSLGIPADVIREPSLFISSVLALREIPGPRGGTPPVESVTFRADASRAAVRTREGRTLHIAPCGGGAKLEVKENGASLASLIPALLPGWCAGELCSPLEAFQGGRRRKSHSA